MEDETIREYDYFAFISYSGRDEKWAKWLHSHLENYHIPTKLCAQYPSLPKKIQPVFWYKVDLSGTNLKSSLQKELKASQYLILICSPHSAKAPWVNDEIEAFSAVRGKDRIIPFIVAGKPHSSSPDEECFPPALLVKDRNEELRGINPHEVGKKKALVDVVATMFNVRFDSLWQRHKRREIRNRIICSIIGVLLVAFAICSFLYFKTSKEYYQSYELCKGMPTGIDRIEKSDLKNQFFYYTFESSRGKLRRVVHCDHWGIPANESASWSQFKTAIIELGYENERLRSINYKNDKGKILYKVVYSNDYQSADIKDGESGNAASLFKSSSSVYENMDNWDEIDFNTIFSRTKSQIARYIYKYDDDGFIKQVLFKRYNGSHETGFDDNGICGIEYERDLEHRVIEKRYLDENQEYREDKFGCMGCEYRYDPDGRVVFERFFDADRQNQLNEIGYAIGRIRYDLRSLTVEEQYFNIDDEPTINIFRYHKESACIVGDTLSLRYYSTDLEPAVYYNAITQSDGFFHKMSTVRNKKGLIHECYVYDCDLKPCYELGGTHKRTIEYDSDNNPIRIINYNISGERQNNLYGVCEIRLEYDTEGRRVTTSFFNHRGNPINSHQGFCKNRITYENDRAVRYTYWDANGMPTYAVSTFGAPVIELEYDDFGNVCNLLFKDLKDGRPCDGAFSVTRIKASYLNGNCVAQQYYGADGKAATAFDGYAGVRFKYDERGRMTECEYLDTEGKLVETPSLGIAKLESTYDRYGNIIESRTYDKEHHLKINKDGWAIKKCEYRGKLLTCLKTFDTDSRPMLSPIGAHEKVFEYDKNRLLAAERYYGLEHDPVVVTGGYFEIIYDYNIFGLLMSNSCFGLKREPVNCNNGFHRVVFSYGEKNNVLRQEYYDTQGKLAINTSCGYALVENKHNQLGLLTETIFYDENRQMKNNLSGYCRTVMRYSPTGFLVYQAFIGDDGKLTNSLQGNVVFAKMVNFVDDNDNHIGSVCLDENNQEVGVGMGIYEGNNLKGYLFRQYEFNDAVLKMPDGNTKIYSRSSFLPNADSTSARYHHALDSLVTVAKNYQ